MTLDIDPLARFHRLALALPGVTEGTHMGAVDFRRDHRIFATLAYAAEGLATLKLTPEQQAAFLQELPEYAHPAPGGWGRLGMTLIRLDAPESVLVGALRTAFQNVTPRRPAAKPRPPRP